MERIRQLKRAGIASEHLHLSLRVGAARRGGEKVVGRCRAETIPLVFDHHVQVASREGERAIQPNRATQDDPVVQIADGGLGPQRPQPHRPAQGHGRAEGVVHQTSPRPVVPAGVVGGGPAQQRQRLIAARADAGRPRDDLELGERAPVMAQAHRVHAGPVLPETDRPGRTA